MKSHGTVYLIHFDEPYKHAQHYLGFAHTGKLEERLEHHRAGNGARLMAVIVAAGIAWSVARLWEDTDKDFERRLKNRGGLRRQCPICKQLTAS